MNEKEFLESMIEIPYWIKDKEDALKFAKHLEYRLIQKEEFVKSIFEKLKVALSSEFLDEITAEAETEVEKYDDWYKNLKKD